MAKMNSEHIAAIIATIVMITILALAFGLPSYFGYHMEWSWVNGRWIWVK